ncbi:hypothetical protein Tco_0190871, partial [Tanacetum coccineum]
MLLKKAMCAIDGAGFDWSDMEKDEIQANIALMAFTDSEANKESDNSKENSDDSLEQHQITDTETSSVKSSLKVYKDWKEKFFYPTNHVREVEPKKVRENNDAPIIEDWMSDDDDDDEPNPKVEKKIVIPTATKKEFVKPEKPVRRPVSCPNVHKHIVPRAVLMKTGLKTVNNARPVNTVSKGLGIQWCNVKRSCDMKTLIAIWGKFPSGNNGSACIL